MTKTLLSLAGYGRTHAVSKQAAAKWKADGHLVLVDNQIDAEASDERLKAAKLGRFRRTAADDQPESNPDFAERAMRGEFASNASAERIKENALAVKHLLDARKRAGELIEVAAVEVLFFEEFRAARNAWLNFPTRVGPMIAAELGIESERVVEALVTYVHQQLADLGEPDIDFHDEDHPATNRGASRVDAATTDKHPGMG